MRLDFISDSRNFKLTSNFGVIMQMWLILFPNCYKWYLSQVIMLCGPEALHDVVLTKTTRIEEREIVIPGSHIGKMSNLISY